MSNSLTWKNFREIEARKERKEKRTLFLERIAITFCWLAIGYFLGRFVEFLIRLKMGFYF